MKRFGYFEKLSLAARWLLPQEDARSMIEDYKDILFETKGPEEALQRFGPPWRPALELVEPAKFRRWLVAFLYMMFSLLFPVAIWISHGIMSDCKTLMFNGLLLWLGWEILLAGKYARPVLFLLGGTFSLFVIWGNVTFQPYLAQVFPFFDDFYIYEPECFLIAGAVSLLYFGFKPLSERKLSRPLLFAIIIVALAVVGIYGLCYYLFYLNIYPLAYHQSLVWIFCILGAMFFLAAAVASVCMARMFDRRWRVVFILSMVGLLFCLFLGDLCGRRMFSPGIAGHTFYNVFFDRNNPDYLFSNRWGSNINVFDEVFNSFSWYIGLGSAMAFAGLF